MNQDATTEAEERVELPSTTSGQGIEAHLDAKETAESSPASEEQHEEKSNGVQKRINDLTAKRYQAEREADELRAKLAQVEAQKPVEQSTHVQDVKAPSLPEDLYDDEAMKKYHAENLKYQEHLAEQKAKAVFESLQKASVEQAQQAKQQETVNKYINNAMRDGVDIDKLKGAEATLNQAGISNELVAFIINDDNGAKIAEYLADNPAEMYDILSMDSVSAGIAIATKVKPKVLTQTPKVSNAPEPVPEITGGGYVEVDEFNKKYPGAEFI